MDAKELFVHEFDDAGYQLSQVFAGLPEESWDAKVHPSAMSARETAAHLAEAYVACSKEVQGNEHEWGSYQPASAEPQGLLGALTQERNAARAAVLASADPHALKSGLAFTANHDYYHVGQMATLRLHLDPEWDAYCIYKG